MAGKGFHDEHIWHQCSTALFARTFIILVSGQLQCRDDIQRKKVVRNLSTIYMV